jgi:hypothetical protein
MSLPTISDVREVPANDCRHQDSPGANRAAGDPSEDRINTGSANDASRGSRRPLTNAKYEQFAHLIARGESAATPNEQKRRASER